jgi:hypothetical protein
VVVVRAWRDSNRVLIRVLVSGDRSTTAREWVFADVGAACSQIAEVLGALVDDQIARPVRGDTRR